jgi:hypothetical protein
MICNSTFSLREQVDKLKGSNQASQGLGNKAGNNPEGQRETVHVCSSQTCQQKKRVPSCAVCLKPMDMLNPYLELTKKGINLKQFSMNMGGLGTNMDPKNYGSTGSL